VNILVQLPNPKGGDLKKKSREVQPRKDPESRKGQSRAPEVVDTLCNSQIIDSWRNRRKTVLSKVLIDDSLSPLFC
jgi:hypothetical protein